MLTRLEVDGFKNLDRIDVRLGPFTCIARTERGREVQPVRRHLVPGRAGGPAPGRKRRRPYEEGNPVRQEPGRKFAWSVVVERDGSLVAAR